MKIRKCPPTEPISKLDENGKTGFQVLTFLPGAF
jgi:hypothetical protein